MLQQIHSTPITSLWAPGLSLPRSSSSCPPPPGKGLPEASEKQPTKCISSACDCLLPGLPLHPTANIIMDGASKKRKLFSDDLDEENEEEKIERFFALITGIREARDRLMNVSDPALKPEIDGKNKKRKLEEEKKQVTVWKPLFQREDFMAETEKLKDLIPAAAVSTSLVDSSQRKEAVKNDENKASLDLNLSL
ncbi:hypothetical protein Peur_048386 [Populus x canadensis]